MTTSPRLRSRSALVSVGVGFAFIAGACGDDVSATTLPAPDELPTTPATASETAGDPTPTTVETSAPVQPTDIPDMSSAPVDYVAVGGTGGPAGGAQAVYGPPGTISEEPEGPVADTLVWMGFEFDAETRTSTAKVMVDNKPFDVQITRADLFVEGMDTALTQFSLIEGSTWPSPDALVWKAECSTLPQGKAVPMVAEFELSDGTVARATHVMNTIDLTREGERCTNAADAASIDWG